MQCKDIVSLCSILPDGQRASHAMAMYGNRKRGNKGFELIECSQRMCALFGRLSLCMRVCGGGPKVAWVSLCTRTMSGFGPVVAEPPEVERKAP